MNNKNNLRYALDALALSVSAASLAAPSEAQQFTEFRTPGKPNLSICKSSLLVSTPLGLSRCLQASNVVKRLQKLEDIASLNDGNRAAATPGYQTSVGCVKQTLQEAGYKVSVQPFPFTVYYPKGPGSLNVIVPQSVTYEWERGLTYLLQTEAGDVTVKVVPVDLSLGASNTSTNGCEAESFTNFPASSIALIQRGICNFEQKAENAAATGAAEVIIFNQGNTDDRKGLENVTMGESYEGGISVIFATYDNDVAWSQTPDLQLHLVVDVVRKKTETYNVVAETRRSSPNNVVMVGAHLDSVFEGPGINDNGLSSAAQLEMAVLLVKALPVNEVRFTWWGAEEAGLVGSTHYVQNLAPEEKKKIKAYLSFDMIGSPNFGSFICDGDSSNFGLQGPPGSAAIERLFEAYFRPRGQQSEGAEVDFRSNYAEFSNSGIAFDGLFADAEGLKTEEQMQKYGGIAGKAYDECYHNECDGIANINQDALETHSDAMAFVTSWLSLSTRVVDDKIAAAGQKAQSRSPQMQKSASQIERRDHDFIK